MLGIGLECPLTACAVQGLGFTGSGRGGLGLTLCLGELHLDLSCLEHVMDWEGPVAAGGKTVR